MKLSTGSTVIELIQDTRHLCTRRRIHGIKAMSRGISGGKHVIKCLNTSNRGRVCLSFQKDKAILNLQNVTFDKFHVIIVCCEHIHGR